MKKKITLLISSIIMIILILSILFVVLTYISDSKNATIENNKISTINIFDTEYTQKQQITIDDHEMTNDYDSDGLTNQEELLIGTDIYIKDTDKDGLTDYQEKNIYFSNPLITSSAKDDIKDGIKVYYGFKPTDKLSKEIIDKEESFSDENIGVSIQTKDIDSRVFHKIYTHTPIYNNIPIYKSFYIFNVNNAKVTVNKTADMKEDLKVFYFDEINNETTDIAYKIVDNTIEFNVNKPNLPIYITSIQTYDQLIKRYYIIIKSKSFILNGYRIYEKSNSFFAEKNAIEINENEIDLDGLQLKIKNVGILKNFVYDRIASFLQSSSEKKSNISIEKLHMSRIELINHLSKKDEEFIIGEDTFFINNFSTDLNRKSHSAGLTFIPAYFKNKEIPYEQNYLFEEFRKTTNFDFGRDVKAYEDIFNKKFGKYKFKYSVPEKASLDIIDNPDKQVYKFIEMYNNFFFTNRENFKIKKMKNYSETIMSLTETINNNNFFVIGINNQEKGHFLLGYDIVGQENSSILKIKVFDPNIYSNKINGKHINNELYLYPEIETIVTNEKTTSQYTKYNFSYNPVSNNKYYFDSNTYNIEFFNKF